MAGQIAVLGMAIGASVHVPMVRIGHMRMGVRHRLVRVSVAVRARDEIAVHMVVVSVAVRVRMFVRELVMSVLVTVRLHQVECHAQQHQHPADRHHRAHAHALATPAMPAEGQWIASGQ